MQNIYVAKCISHRMLCFKKFGYVEYIIRRDYIYFVHIAYCIYITSITATNYLESITRKLGNSGGNSDDRLIAFRQ